MDSSPEKSSDSADGGTGTTTGSISEGVYDVEACTHEPSRLRFAFWRKSKPTATSSAPEAARSDPYPTITRPLDKFRVGYPKVATFQCSDPSFLQFRNFGYLHTRLLLALQQDIEALERLLDRLDEFDDSKYGDLDLLTCKRRDDRRAALEDIENVEFHKRFKKTRPQILSELNDKIVAYDELLLKTKQVLTLQKPSTKDYQSVRDWLKDEKPLVPNEMEFIERKEEVVTLRTGRESAKFDFFVEETLMRLDRRLAKLFGWRIIESMFVTPELQDKTASRNFRYYAPHRVDAIVNGIITIVIFILMVLPVVALYEMSEIDSTNPFEAIAVLIVFTLLFACAMSGLTRASRHELFAASAAYCAVLVVFISNFSPQNVSVDGTVDVHPV